MGRGWVRGVGDTEGLGKQLGPLVPGCHLPLIGLGAFVSFCGVIPRWQGCSGGTWRSSGGKMPTLTYLHPSRTQHPLSSQTRSANKFPRPR